MKTVVSLVILVSALLLATGVAFAFCPDRRCYEITANCGSDGTFEEFCSICLSDSAPVLNCSGDQTYSLDIFVFDHQWIGYGDGTGGTCAGAWYFNLVGKRSLRGIGECDDVMCRVTGRRVNCP